LLVAGLLVFQRHLMKHVLSILGVLILAGCVVIPSERVTFNDIKIGMPRDEAVALLGKPSRVSAKGNVEHLYYNESALYIGILGIGKVRNDKREYEMRLVDGKVDSFGEVGEYIEEDDASDSDN
tara:strand:+ start:1885 stop:2256 length:372 start_codon:yes stop_codon:yes gene_type:complete